MCVFACVRVHVFVFVCVCVCLCACMFDSEDRERAIFHRMPSSPEPVVNEYERPRKRKSSDYNNEMRVLSQSLDSDVQSFREQSQWPHEDRERGMVSEGETRPSMESIEMGDVEKKVDKDEEPEQDVEEGELSDSNSSGETEKVCVCVCLCVLGCVRKELFDCRRPAE